MVHSLAHFLQQDPPDTSDKIPPLNPHTHSQQDPFHDMPLRKQRKLDPKQGSTITIVQPLPPKPKPRSVKRVFHKLWKRLLPSRTLDSELLTTTFQTVHPATSANDAEVAKDVPHDDTDLTTPSGSSLSSPSLAVSKLPGSASGQEDCAPVSQSPSTDLLAFPEMTETASPTGDVEAVKQQDESTCLGYSQLPADCEGNSPTQVAEEPLMSRSAEVNPSLSPLKSATSLEGETRTPHSCLDASLEVEISDTTSTSSSDLFQATTVGDLNLTTQPEIDEEVSESRRHDFSWLVPSKLTSPNNDSDKYSLSSPHAPLVTDWHVGTQAPQVPRAPFMALPKPPTLGIKDETTGEFVPEIDVRSQHLRFPACVKPQVVSHDNWEYTIIGRVYGNGPMQLVVATARQLHSKHVKRVALKVYNKELAYLLRGSAPGKRDIVQEIDNMTHITKCSDGKDGLVPLKHTFEDAENVYLVMPFFNQTLAQINQRDWHDKATWYAICKKLWQLILALEVLHVDCHIAHRDIKPQNILVDMLGNIWFCDFGFSHRFESAEGRLCSFGGGTAGFVPPEANITRSADWKYDGYAGDIWSLGCVFYSFISGGRSYERSSGGYGDTMTWEAVKNKDHELADMLIAMLDVRPEKRPTVQELKEYPFFKRGGNGTRIRFMSDPDEEFRQEDQPTESKARPESSGSGAGLAFEPKAEIQASVKRKYSGSGSDSDYEGDSIVKNQSGPMSHYPRLRYDDLAYERGIHVLLGSAGDPNIARYWREGVW